MLVGGAANCFYESVTPYWPKYGGLDAAAPALGGAVVPAVSLRQSGILPGVFVSNDTVIGGRVLPAKPA
jgi:hypothetical protein